MEPYMLRGLFDETSMLGEKLEACADAWEAERKDNAALRELLCQCRSAIVNVPDKKVFGIGGDGMTHWYLADELVANIDAALASKESET